MQVDGESAARQASTDSHVAARRRSSVAWHRLGDRIRSLTPSALARIFLVLVGIVALGWVIGATWPAIVPFIVGAAIAYAVLPLVNALNRVMPRVMAAILSTALVLLIVLAIPLLILRVVVLELYGTYQSLPNADQLRTYIEDLNQRMSNWPEPIQLFVRLRLENAVLNIRGQFVNWVSNTDGLVIHLLLTLVHTVGILLGLLVLPVWLLVALRDQHTARSAIDRHLPDWMEGDFWAVAKILDRTLGAYLRGLCVIALALGFGFAFALRGLTGAGVDGINYPVALGLLAAVLELIPTIGPIIAVVAVFLLTVRSSLNTAIAVVVTYIVVRMLVRRFIGRRVDERVIDLHPAILIIGVVLLSQFGLGWTLFAAPLIAIARDLFRYTYGRLSDPARPAGLLPGEAETVAETQAPAAPTVPSSPAAPAAPAAPSVRPVPLVYRRIESQKHPVPPEHLEPASGE